MSPFSDDVQRNPFLIALNRALDPLSDVFWESQKDRFVSREALLEGADVVELVMTRNQFRHLFRKAQDNV